MWQLSVSWWELILRVVTIYGFLLVILRLSGKRQVGQLAPFDLVLLLVLSNSVQNAMNGGDNSLLAGLISAGVLVLLNYAVGLATYRSKRIEALVEGRPEVLIHNGRLFTDVMEREKLTHHELNAALRAAGCACVEEVHFAILENNGLISVQSKKERPGPGRRWIDSGRGTDTKFDGPLLQSKRRSGPDRAAPAFVQAGQESTKQP